jgi:hypothetical protein
MQADAIRAGEVQKLAPLWEEHSNDCAKAIEQLTAEVRRGGEQFDRAVDEWERLLAGAEVGKT